MIILCGKYTNFSGLQKLFKPNYRLNNECSWMSSTMALFQGLHPFFRQVIGSFSRIFCISSSNGECILKAVFGKSVL